MDAQLLDINNRINKLEMQQETTEKRVDNIEKVADAIHEMAKNVGVMANEMSHMKNDISILNKNVNKYHNEEPTKLIFNAKNGIMLGVISALVSAFMALILK